MHLKQNRESSQRFRNRTRERQNAMKNRMCLAYPRLNRPRTNFMLRFVFCVAGVDYLEDRSERSRELSMYQSDPTLHIEQIDVHIVPSLVVRL
jgi:hypothetical protein